MQTLLSSLFDSVDIYKVHIFLEFVELMQYNNYENKIDVFFCFAAIILACPCKLGIVPEDMRLDAAVRTPVLGWANYNPP